MSDFLKQLSKDRTKTLAIAVSGFVMVLGTVVGVLSVFHAGHPNLAVFLTLVAVGEAVAFTLWAGSQDLVRDPLTPTTKDLKRAEEAIRYTRALSQVEREQALANPITVPYGKEDQK